MQPDVRAESEDWMRRALRDLQAAERVIRGSDPLSDIAAFHAQQAAEKVLKAFLVAHGQAFAKTHDLGQLLRQCASTDPDLARFLSPLVDMSPYAIRFRYPGGPLEPGVDEARQALIVARELIDVVRDKLGLSK